MGTRHLTMVKMNKKTVVAQYGQWDGYPTGAGVIIAEFLKTIKATKAMNNFKKQLQKVSFIDSKKEDALIELTCNIPRNAELITFTESDRIKKELPSLHRDTGANVLSLIRDGKVLYLKNDEQFRKEHLFCEYAYIINLDDKKVTIEYGYHDRKKKTYSFDKFTVNEMKALETKL